MPLSARTRRALKTGLRSAEAADDIADIVDAVGGTITAASKRRLIAATCNRKAANLLETGINAGTAISDYAQRRLALAIADQGAANEIADALAAE